MRSISKDDFLERAAWHIQDYLRLNALNLMPVLEIARVHTGNGLVETFEVHIATEEHLDLPIIYARKPKDYDRKMDRAFKQAVDGPVLLMVENERGPATAVLRRRPL